MRFMNDSFDRATLNIRETEPDFVSFRLWLHPGFRCLSVDKVVLKLLCSDLGVSTGELNHEVGHRSSVCRIALVKAWRVSGGNLLYHDCLKALFAAQVGLRS